MRQVQEDSDEPMVLADEAQDEVVAEHAEGEEPRRRRGESAQGPHGAKERPGRSLVAKACVGAGRHF